MLAFPSAIKIYAAVQPVDMRKQFNGLWTAAQEQLREDPKNGALFVFINKERTRLKLLGRHGRVGPGETPGAGPLLLAVAGR
mgnify:CR=1 FL=1